MSQVIPYLQQTLEEFVHAQSTNELIWHLNHSSE